ncbi:MAG: SMI1/KNR4 family protein [Myxococcaceae bacterium]
MFETFKRELLTHDAPGYHNCFHRPEVAVVEAWFRARNLDPSPSYLDFLAQIGPGRYFAGHLEIHPLTAEQGSPRSLETELKALKEMAEMIEEPLPWLPFGYDGTTEMSYCLKATGKSDSVYWFSWEDGSSRVLAPTFANWLEAQPSELFSKRSYAGYKKLTHIPAFEAVMRERAAFSLRLLRYDPRLQKQEPTDFFARYHRITLEVTKARSVSIDRLTFMARRLGSKYGPDNVHYVSVPVGDVAVGIPTVVECFVFDPFNVQRSI